MAPAQAMALYDSRHRPSKFTIANTRPQPLAVTHSSQWEEGQRSPESPDIHDRSDDSRMSRDVRIHFYAYFLLADLFFKEFQSILVEKSARFPFNHSILARVFSKFLQN